MAALKLHLRKTFKFSPSATTELFLQPHNITDAAPDGHSFDFLDVPNYLKMHLIFHLQIHYEDYENIGNSLSWAYQAAYDRASKISSRSR